MRFLDLQGIYDLVDAIKDRFLTKKDGVLETYTEKLVVIGGANIINLQEGNTFVKDVTENTNFTIANPKAQVHSFTLFIAMGATARTITFPASVKWDSIPDMTEPNKEYILTFVSKDSGVNWYGMFGGAF